MTTLQALLIAVLQGVTELFPVSSLGHAVVLPALFGWSVDQHSPDFLPFLVVLHVGTAAALLAYFWRDWIGIARAVLGFAEPKERAFGRRLLLLIIIATIPAVIVGFTLEKWLRGLFGNPVMAAIFLILNGVLLFTGERLRRRAVKRSGTRSFDELGMGDALVIGLWQCTALFPGISRSGATIVGGLLRGLHHDVAAHFSFLIATPIIAGAAVLEVPKLLHHAEGAPGITSLSLIAGVVAGITAFISTAVLMRYFKRHDFDALDPFAYYCMGFGLIALGFLLF
jgi:undecaprenyl-diphosphatase